MSEIPSIIEQAYPWRAGFFDFGKAKRDDVTYFNCAILERGDTDWLIVRRAVWRPGLKMGQNGLMAFKLDSRLVPQVGFKIHMPGTESEHFEDPRCCIHAKNLWISACNFIVYGTQNSRWTGAHQVLCKVDPESWRGTERFDPVYGKNGPSLHGNIHAAGNTQDVHEKNWLWFSHEGALYMIYCAVPHIVTRWSDDVKFHAEWTTAPNYMPWRYGEIRGGTTPILAGGEYWTFFHSSLPWIGKKRQYHMGAYAFEARPPFRMTRITTRPIISGSTNDEWLPGKPPCVFPCGAIYRNKDWLVVGGSNDLSCFHIRIPHAELFERTVSTLEGPKAKSGWLTKAGELLTSQV